MNKKKKDMQKHWFYAAQFVQLLESFLQSLRLLVVEAEVPVAEEAAEAVLVMLLVLLSASKEFGVPSSLSEAEPPSPSAKLRISGLSDTVLILSLESSRADRRPFSPSSPELTLELQGKIIAI